MVIYNLGVLFSYGVHVSQKKTLDLIQQFNSDSTKSELAQNPNKSE